MSELIYQLRDVTKEYDGRRVLHVDRLDIRRGEIFGLLGPGRPQRCGQEHPAQIAQFPGATYQGMYSVPGRPVQPRSIYAAEAKSPRDHGLSATTPFEPECVG